MFHPPLDIDEGLLLVYKKENRIDTVIHMFFMRMDLTVVWVNEINEVVDVRLAKRWRPAYTPKKPAKFVLELSEEHISSFQVGDRLSFKNPESRFSFEG